MLSFVFVSGSIHKDIVQLWLLFFSTCTAEYEVVSKLYAGMPASKTFTFDNTDLRFSSRMVDFMHEGAKAACDRCTVVFLSDTSVPLMRCDSVYAMLDDKLTYDFSVKECTTASPVVDIEWMRPNCTCNGVRYIKYGSQWISVPKSSWVKSYHKVDKNLCYLSRANGFTSGSPDEFYIQTRLTKPNNFRSTHFITWPKNGDGHPSWLTIHAVVKAVKGKYPFARKYKPNQSIRNFINHLLINGK